MFFSQDEGKGSHPYIQEEKRIGEEDFPYISEIVHPGRILTRQLLFVSKDL